MSGLSKQFKVSGDTTRAPRLSSTFTYPSTDEEVTKTCGVQLPPARSRSLHNNTSLPRCSAPSQSTQQHPIEKPNCHSLENEEAVEPHHPATDLLSTQQVGVLQPSGVSTPVGPSTPCDATTSDRSMWRSLTSSVSALFGGKDSTTNTDNDNHLQLAWTPSYKTIASTSAAVNKCRDLTKKYKLMRTMYIRDAPPRRQSFKRALASNDKALLLHLIKVRGRSGTTATSCNDCCQAFRYLIHPTRYCCEVCHKIMCHHCRRSLQIFPSDLTRDFLVTVCCSCHTYVKSLHWLLYGKGTVLSNQLQSSSMEASSLNTSMCITRAQLEGLIRLASSSPSSFPLEFRKEILKLNRNLEESMSRLVVLFKSASQTDPPLGTAIEETIRRNLMLYIRQIIKREKRSVTSVQTELLELIESHAVFATPLSEEELCMLPRAVIASRTASLESKGVGGFDDA